MSISASEASAINRPVARWEWVAVCGLLVAAAMLRFSFPDRLAVEHFDEGVYASNIWFGDRPDRAYPAQHLYAPPLLPALIEWCFVFSGPSNVAAMWPSQAAGVLSVLLLWWLGRSWFGPVAGLVGAAFGSTNEVLVLLSRSALTDSLLGMWWLAAVWALRRACDSGTSTDRLVAGLLVALAWFTKYNGWMPLGIAIGAVVLRGVVCRGIWGQTKTALTSCFIAGVIAFATWSPWLWSLQSKGGYASVAANHRQYIVGPRGWWGSALRQYEQLATILGPVSRLGFELTYLVLLLALVLLRRATQSIECAPGESTMASPSGEVADDTILPAVPALTGLLVFAIALAAVHFGLSILAPVAVIVWWRLLNSCYYRDTPDTPGGATDLGYWILSVWFGGLVLATPLYTPYLRLTLPWLLAACLGIGMVFQQVWHFTLRINSRWPLVRLLYVLTAAQVLAVVIVLLSVLIPPAFRPTPAVQLLRALPDQRSLPSTTRAIAAKISAATDPASDESPHVVVYVYGEPSLMFQLRHAGLQNVAPVSSLQFARTQNSNADVRIYLAVGIHALSDPRFREQFAAANGQFRRVGRWPWQLGPLVALDQADCNPRLLGRNPVESAAVELYEVLAP